MAVLNDIKRYTPTDLAKILKTEPENVMKFVEHSDFAEKVEIGDTKYILEERLEEFFKAYVMFHGLNPMSYEIPDELVNLNNSWAITIIEMYNKNFACPASISPGQGQLLKDIICDLNPHIILEIGCFIGISTMWMASGLEEIGSTGFIHSVDLFNTIMPSPPHMYGYLKNPIDYAKKSARSAQLSNRINFYKMDSNEMGKKYSRIINKPIDFLFIDGDHTIHGCINDFVLFYPHVPIGGHIMLHDIHPEYCGWEGPRYLIDKYIKNSPHFELTEIDTLPNNYGMALIRKISEDKRMHTGGSLILEIQKTKAKLAKTALWNSIRGTSFGKLIKKRLG